MRPSNRLPTSIGLLLLAALLIAGCSRVVGPRQWTATADLVSGGTYVIDVRDTSGRVDNVEIDPAGVDVFGGIANPPGQPNVVIVPWTGGACDQRTDIAIAANGPGLALTIKTAVSGDICTEIAVGHSLRITGPEPIPAAAVTATTAP